MYKHNKIQRCCVTKIVNRDRMWYAILLFCEVTTLSPCITTNSSITWNSYLCSRIPIEWDFAIDVVLVLPIDDNSRISCVSIDSKSRYLCMPATRVSPRSRVGRDRYFRLNQSINPFHRINQLAFPRRRSRFTTRATQFEDWFRWDSMVGVDSVGNIHSHSCGELRQFQNSKIPQNMELLRAIIADGRD